MRAVLQRVKHANVKVDGAIIGKIGVGLLILLGVENTDTEKDAAYLIDKILNLRIFEDSDAKMNLSLLEISGELLVVSQFTLFGDARRGRRPSFVKAATPEKAKSLYDFFTAEALKYLPKVETGKFQADMDVELINDGPVTILLDSTRLF